MSTTNTSPTWLHQGNAITLRRTVPTDAEFLFEKAYQNLDFMHRFRLNDTPQRVEEVRRRLERQWQSTPEQSGYLEMLIIHKQHGPIGLAALADYSPLHRRAEYLIGLFDEPHRQAGYGIETTLLVMDLAFNRYNLHKLDAYTYADNDAGQKNLLGGGFIDEGLRREHLYSKAEGRFIDLRAFGMTRNDFRSNPLRIRISRTSRRLVGYDITQASEKPVATICSSKPASSKGYKLLGSAISVALSLSAPVYAANYDVTAANDDGTGNIANSLSWAIWQANTNPGLDTITLTTDMTITGVMKRLIDSDVTLQNDGTVRTISGGNAYRPLFIKSGNVNIQNLNLNNGLAKGGDSNDGGGGAGLGGALFVYSGTVSIDSVTFSNNVAQGGSGGASGHSSGGGMYGNGNGHGGGGLFTSSTGNEGAYGGPIGNPYGGFGGSDGGGNGGFAGGGGYNSNGNGGNGGFGGGGGKGYNGNGGNGGFGGGGGEGDDIFGGNGGFGGGGGSGWNADGGSGGFGGGSGNRTDIGGGGAGFGGAIFAKNGTVTLNNVTFTNNSATRGTGANNGEGRGGAIFICTPDEGDSECNAMVNDCGNNTFINNSADDGENDVFGTLTDSGNCSSNLVALSDFQIHGNTLSWSTTIELDNAGFNVERRLTGGLWEQINNTLIPATGVSSTYTFTDNSAISDQDYEYRLEDIDTFGSSTFHYPAGAAPVISLVSPADEAVLSSITTPVFQWNATDYDGFRFQYAYPGSGIQTFPTDSWSSTMSFTPEAEWTDFVNQLEAGETVYWRIQGKLDDTEDNYSDVRQFTVE